MADGHEVVVRFLQQRCQRPLWGSIRCMMYGTLLASALTVWNVILNGYPLESVVGFFVVGNSLVFLGWGVERGWFSMISSMLHEPFSLFAYFTRLPFWYIGGGIGYTIGSLIAKKCGFFDLTVIPIKSIFNFGGILGIALQIIIHLRTDLHFMKSYRNLKIEKGDDGSRDNDREIVNTIN